MPATTSLRVSNTGATATKSMTTRLLWCAAAVALAASLSLVTRDAAALPDKPFVEDAFYALSVSRQIGAGHGFTIDGVQATNGVQPLYVVLMAPLYWMTGGERTGTLRLVLGFEWLCWTAAAFGAARLARRWWGSQSAPPAWLTPAAILAWAGSVHLWRQSLNGLETGLDLALLTWTCVTYLGMDRTRTAAYVRFGVLLGVLVLARIDAVFLVILFAAAELARTGGPSRLARAAMVSLVAAALSSPWWIYNYAAFGSIMPTSGQATAGSHFGEWGSERLLLDAAAAGFAPFAWFARWEGAAAQVLRAILAVAIVFAACRIASKRRRDDPSLAALTVVWLAFVASLAVWYLCRSRMNFFYPRYLVPAAVLGVPVAVAAAARLAAGRDWLAVAAALPLTVASCVCPWFAADGAGNGMYRDQLQLVLRSVPATDRVAAQQSGTLGYFRDGVVNLDGKVNPEILAQRGRIEPWLEKEDLRWFCDNRSLVRGALGKDPAAHGWREVASSGQFVLYRRE